MNRSMKKWPSDERGSVMVVVALSTASLLALLALGIDLGGLFNARSEAQRAADAAALAGASAFLEHQESQAHREATQRALEYATSNEIRNRKIGPDEVSVWVDLEQSTVRAAVRRDGVATWFARLFGVDAVDVGAEATAWVAEGGAASCVKPFAVPDMWSETSDDLNRNGIWDEGEHWRFDPSDGDRYSGYSGPSGSANETGYGSHWRDSGVDAQGRRYDRDYGRRITVKVTNPRDVFVPSFFLPWVLPADDDQPDCYSGVGGGRGNPDTGTGSGGSEPGSPGNDDDQEGGVGWINWWEKREDLGVSGNGPGSGRGANPQPGTGGQPGTNPQPGGGEVGRDSGSGRGAAAYRRNICTCNSSIIDLDTEYLIEPGNMVGPTFQGVEALIASDPDAYWDDQSNKVVSRYGMDSPRVVTVALFDPSVITRPGRQYLRFNNFARVFIEEQPTRQDPVTGRFLFYVPGVGRTHNGTTTGSLVRVLQLIR